MLIGEQTAEELKINIGCAYPREDYQWQLGTQSGYRYAVNLNDKLHRHVGGVGGTC